MTRRTPDNREKIGGRQERGRKWARRQLERLERGDLPVAKMSSVEEIRAMRQQRTEHLQRVSKRHERH